MNRRRSRFAPAFWLVEEMLEKRVVLSGGVLPHGAAAVAAQTLRAAATQTSLAVSAGTLSQPMTFTVTVRGPAAAGAPQGTVDLIDHGKVIQSLTLVPATATATNARNASSTATYTLTQPAGGSAYYFGKHTVSARYTPSGAFSRSTASKTVTVSEPAYTTLADGVKIATIAQGSGPAIQSGQTASVLYTGYLEKNGQIFDDSINHGGTPFSFTVGGGQVIPGFDAGVAGMKVGETRIVMIPPAEGYGATASGPIPANSTLIFVLTLESIS
jgi:hypothetical protein